MKKLVEKDKKVRIKIKTFEKKKIIFKMIQCNINLPRLTRFNASDSLCKIPKQASKTLVSNRCLATVNKKKFWKLAHYSRIFSLKLMKGKKIYGLTKASW